MHGACAQVHLVLTCMEGGGGGGKGGEFSVSKGVMHALYSNCHKMYKVHTGFFEKGGKNI